MGRYTQKYALGANVHTLVPLTMGGPGREELPAGTAVTVVGFSDMGGYYRVLTPNGRTTAAYDFELAPLAHGKEEEGGVDQHRAGDR